MLWAILGAISGNSRPESRVLAPDPTLPVRPKPGEAARLPRLPLVKPGRTGDEPLDGPCGHGKPLRAEAIPMHRLAWSSRKTSHNSRPKNLRRPADGVNRNGRFWLSAD